MRRQVEVTPEQMQSVREKLLEKAKVRFQGVPIVVITSAISTMLFSWESFLNLEAQQNLPIYEVMGLLTLLYTAVSIRNRHIANENLDADSRNLRRRMSEKQKDELQGDLFWQAFTDFCRSVLVGFLAGLAIENVDWVEAAKSLPPRRQFQLSTYENMLNSIKDWYDNVTNIELIGGSDGVEEQTTPEGKPSKILSWFKNAVFSKEFLYLGSLAILLRYSRSTIDAMSNWQFPFDVKRRPLRKPVDAPPKRQY